MGERRYSDSDSAHTLERHSEQVLSTLQRVQAPNVHSSHAHSQPAISGNAVLIHCSPPQALPQDPSSTHTSGHKAPTTQTRQAQGQPDGKAPQQPLLVTVSSRLAPAGVRHTRVATHSMAHHSTARAAAPSLSWARGAAHPQDQISLPCTQASMHCPSALLRSCEPSVTPSVLSLVHKQECQC
jgi:hypothetical protein